MLPERIKLTSTHAENELKRRMALVAATLPLRRYSTSWSSAPPVLTLCATIE
jgi:hypothetical protein